MTQGPWERALGLASVHLDIPPGRIRPEWQHFGLDQAHGLLAMQTDRMRTARAADKSTRWMQN
jgi:putative membrane protein